MEMHSVKIFILKEKYLFAMNILVNILLLCVALSVVSGQVHQGGQGHQGRIRRQVSQDPATEQDEDASQVGPVGNPQNWTSCDITAVPKISCHDCNTRLICKPVGGLLLGCNNPYRPHCNNGICSPIPSAECA